MTDTVPSPAVAFSRVSFAFDDHQVLRDISFSIPAGSMHVVLGSSGAGKSVLLKLILGLLRPDEGQISVNGRRVDNMTEPQLLQETRHLIVLQPAPSPPH